VAPAPDGRLRNHSDLAVVTAGTGPVFELPVFAAPVFELPVFEPPPFVLPGLGRVDACAPAASA